MAKIDTLQTIAAGLAGNTTLNANMTKITEAFANTLSLDGSTPNSMGASLDMNSNRIINLATPTATTDAVTKAYADALALNGIPDGDKGDIVVSSSGTTWEFDSSVVTTFAKTLLDDANAAAMRTTLGLVIGTDVQAQDATLQALASALSAAGKIPYATATDTLGELDFLDEDNMVSNSATGVPSQQSVKAYVDGAVVSSTLPDGDYGDVTVSSSGAVITIDDDTIGAAEVASTIITGQTNGTIAATDKIIFSDTDDSGNLKEDTVQGILDLVGSTALSVAVLTYEVASNGTLAGLTVGDWRTATLNTEVFDPDGIVSLSSNQFTPAAGSYIVHVEDNYYYTNFLGFRSRIQNTTDTTTEDESANVGRYYRGGIHTFFINDVGASKALEYQIYAKAALSPTTNNNVHNGDNEIHVKVTLIKVA